MCVCGGVWEVGVGGVIRGQQMRAVPSSDHYCDQAVVFANNLKLDKHPLVLKVEVLNNEKPLFQFLGQ